MIRPVKHPKSQVYRIRKGIPAPLRHLFGGKSELIESLGTKDPAEAKRLAPGVITRIEALIAGAGLRSRGDGVPLSDRRVAELAGCITEKVLRLWRVNPARRKTLNGPSSCWRTRPSRRT
ncbi:DUF6538 domain-containing protein [Siccirubricoccus deserti]